MIVTPIELAEARGLTCLEGGDKNLGCAGRMFRYRLANQQGFSIACENHLFKLGRTIADALHHFRHPDVPLDPDGLPLLLDGKATRGRPGTGLDSDVRDAQGWTIMLNGVSMTKGEFTKKVEESSEEPELKEGEFKWG